MLEENINENQSNEEVEQNLGQEDIKANEEIGESSSDEYREETKVLKEELTEYIHKQIALINETDEKSSVSKISQNEDIIDALKYSDDLKGRSNKEQKKKILKGFEEFIQLVNEKKRITNYEIDRFEFKSRTIDNEVIFESCDIYKLSFIACSFSENVHFKNCKIRHIDLTKSKFLKNLSFENCVFEYGSIKDFSVANLLKLMRCTVNNRCRIGKVKASGFNFWDSRFQEWLELNKCEVTGDVDLRSMHVVGGIEFVNNNLNNLIMRGANVEKPIYMRKTKISGVFDFQRAKFRDYAYFEELEFGKDSKIALWNVISYGIFITPDQIRGRLRSEIKKDYITASAEYGTLKANYEFLSRLDDEDWAYYRFKKMNRLARKDEKLSLRKRVGNFFEWLFFEFGSRYGTSPLRVLGLSLIFILVFAAIYFFPVLCGYMNYQDSSSVMKSYEITGLSFVDVPVSSILHSTSAFVSGFDAVDKNVDGWVSIFLALEALAGMLFLGLFIVSFSRKVIR